MKRLLAGAKPILRALVTSGCGVCAFALLRDAGLGANESLLGGMILAGALNIHDLASLNGDLPVPTSVQAVGEN